MADERSSRSFLVNENKRLTEMIREQEQIILKLREENAILKDDGQKPFKKAVKRSVETANEEWAV